MADVHGARRRTTASVEKERFTIFVAVEDEIEVSVREKQSPPKPAMGSVASQCLKPIEKGLIDQVCIPFPRRECESKIDISQKKKYREIAS